MGHASVAYVTLAIVYTAVRCIACRRRIMDVPGTPEVRVLPVKKPSGRGRALRCPRCHVTNEVIEYG